LFHFHFSKLYLYSHVFRGLGKLAIPDHFLEAAHGAITAATSIINMILTDADVKSSLVGFPCYVQSMIAFACMILAKLATTYGDDLVERHIIVDLISQLIVVYQNTPVGKWHLVHLMPNGLNKILKTLQGSNKDSSPSLLYNREVDNSPSNLTGDFGLIGQFNMSMLQADPNFLMDPVNLILDPSEQYHFGGGAYSFEQ
jgi:hypothetical protein